MRGEYDARNCSVEHTSIGARSWLVRWNFARFRLWDAVRSIDYMATREELDLSKLAVVGNSGGGTMSAYLQAFDERIKVACPNCYISSLREVIRERGCHDSEQFFYGQLANGFNHAALVVLGQPRGPADRCAPHQTTSRSRACAQPSASSKVSTSVGASSSVALYGYDGAEADESSRQATLACSATM